MNPNPITDIRSPPAADADEGDSNVQAELNSNLISIPLKYTVSVELFNVKMQLWAAVSQNGVEHTSVVVVTTVATV